MNLANQRDLDELWDRTAFIHVFDEVRRPATPAQAAEVAKFLMEEFGVVDDGATETVAPLFVLDIVARSDLEEFQRRCRVLDGDEGIALCTPSYFFVAFDHRYEPIANIGYIPPEMLRWSDRWDGDGDLEDPFALVDWLERRRVIGPARMLARQQRAIE